jgi:hypothetical protein
MKLFKPTAALGYAWKLYVLNELDVISVALLHHGIQYWLSMLCSVPPTNSKPASLMMLLNKYSQLIAGVKSLANKGLDALVNGRVLTSPFSLHL